MGSVAAGSSRAASVTIKGSELGNGARKLYLVADANKQVVETNEENNKAYRTVNVAQALYSAEENALNGSASDDVIAGSMYDDVMYGNGGDDIFCFGNDWGNDTVDQLASGSVTLWFEEGSEDNWNADTQIYSDGTNFVVVTGCTDVKLIFGDGDSLPAGAFDNAVLGNVFEKNENGMLA